MPATQNAVYAPVRSDLAAAISAAWQRRAAILLTCGAVLALLIAGVRIPQGLWRLLYFAGPRRVYDLRFRTMETKAWFSGEPVYGKLETADYPPAAYPVLWPFVGWADISVIRWIWAGTMLAMLAWLAVLIIRESGAESLPEKAVLALLPFAAYSTYAVMNTGQLILHILPALLVGLFLLTRPPTSLWRDVGATALLLAALVKPTLSVPFFWIAFFVPKRWRPALLIAGGYIALTLFAAAFQQGNALDLVKGWLGQRGNVQAEQSSANVHAWLFALHQEQLLFPIALTLLLGLAVWTYRRRAADFWVLAGFAAVVARMWMYHRYFDDLLILIPMIALWRAARLGSDQRLRLTAGVLAGALWASLLLPRLTINDYPTVELLVVDIMQPLLWLLAAAVLAYAAAPGRLRQRFDAPLAA
jgi:hypothetical protein